MIFALVWLVFAYRGAGVSWKTVAGLMRGLWRTYKNGWIRYDRDTGKFAPEDTREVSK